MPKIIENLKERLIAETKRQLEASGYSAVTIRSVAKACGVGVGTVYNYFPCKEALIATHLLEDWNMCVHTITQAAQCETDPRPVVKCIYEQLVCFAHRHQVIFRDETAAAGFAGSFSQYHGRLRCQLADPVRKFCDSDFTALFVAESLLTWAMAGKSFEEIYNILKKLF
jgi:AcrR family transcriptional regulator